MLAVLNVRSAARGIAVETLPFAAGDATGGTENELQAVVIGDRDSVDLPLAIEQSKYFANVERRLAAGEASRSAISDLQRYLSENKESVWENSWARFPLHFLGVAARETLESDLGAKTHDLSRAMRSDRSRFLFRSDGEWWLRVPISYLVRLALADVIDRLDSLPFAARAVALGLMDHFSNDNTSPETFSFHVIPSADDFGGAVAREMARRFLLTHLLVEWANKNFALEANGQRALVYFAPHPPLRQKELNNCISDAFYRELFMSPCLYGWEDGEEKREYMHLAHQALSRSQLNGVAKLRESGIVANNLVVLPNTSTVTLANNGAHLSLGSRKLSAELSNPTSGFTALDEKRIGDLVIKISEHFLPLFVNTFTAAPYRLSFSDFHPERALGFLPHELDYTHLRMLWRHWRQKAQLRIFGHGLTPYGPRWIDELLAWAFRLRGDLVPDFRLVDFPVAWLATDESSALDGALGNVDGLKDDLDRMGVLDRRLKLYLPISLREYSSMGFSGFEARQFSLFEGIFEDFSPAVSLQQVVIMLAFKYVLSGTYDHQQIPSDPSSESERRQPFFYTALGLKAFNVRARTPNVLLQRILQLVRKVRASRHRGYFSVSSTDYCLALLRLIREDASDLLELLNLTHVIADLEARLKDKNRQAYGKLVGGILQDLGKSTALKVDAHEWNKAAENYYRTRLRRQHLKEAFDSLRESVIMIARIGDSWPATEETLASQDALSFLNQVEDNFLADTLTPEQLRRLLSVVLNVVADDSRKGKTATNRLDDVIQPTSVH